MGSLVKKNIPNNAKDIVIFVHGFGVRWDSRRMFTEIVDNLKNNWDFVLFDFYEVEEPNVYVKSINEQTKKLKEMVAKINVEYPMSNIHIIAHSLGCIVTALAKPDIKGKIILLAPPESMSGLQPYFESLPEVEKLNNHMIVPRKDGTVIHIPYKFFEEIKNINPQEKMKKYSEKHAYIIVQTMKDEVIGSTSYNKLRSNKNINILQLNADHNFTGENRHKLVALIGGILK